MPRFSLKEPIKNYKIPQTDDKIAVGFIANWLNNRRQQLYNNIKDSRTRYMLNRNTGEYSSESDLSLLNYLRGINPNRVITNKAFYTEIENSAGAKMSDKTPNALGSYDRNTREIKIRNKNDIGTRIHERTHAAEAEPQKRIVGDILKTNKFKFVPNQSGGYDPRYANKKYLYDPSEVYSRMMEYRYNSKLSPNTIIDKNYLNKNRKLLESHDLDIIDDDTLIRLFNEVAYNNINDNRISLEDIYYG